MKFNSIPKTIFYGLCLGISILPPGFSVATMAMILGIYEDLITLLNDLFSPRFKSGLKALISLGIGAVVAIAVFSRLISDAISLFAYQTNFFFLGMIVATVPLLYKQANVKQNFTLKHRLFLGLAVIITASFAFTNNAQLVELSREPTVLQTLFLVFAGFLVSCSMILPGLSGALMLILLGAYQFLLDSVTTLDLAVLGSVTVGGVIGLVFCGKLIKHLIENNETTLYSISLGLVIGSILVVLSSGIPTGLELLTSLGMAIVGFMSVTILNLKR